MSVPPEVQDQASRVLERGMPADRLASLLQQLADEWDRRGKRAFSFRIEIHGHGGQVRGMSFDPGKRDL